MDEKREKEVERQANPESIAERLKAFDQAPENEEPDRVIITITREPSGISINTTAKGFPQAELIGHLFTLQLSLAEKIEESSKD